MDEIVTYLKLTNITMDEHQKILDNNKKYIQLEKILREKYYIFCNMCDHNRLYDYEDIGDIYDNTKYCDCCHNSFCDNCYNNFHGCPKCKRRLLCPDCFKSIESFDQCDYC